MPRILRLLAALYTLLRASREYPAELEAAAREIYGDASAPRELASVPALRAEILRLALWRPHGFDTEPDATLAQIWNGYGPDAWPEWLRLDLTWVYRHFQPVACIHDYQFARSDGTRAGWDLTQAYWLANSSLMLSDRYPLRNPLLWPPRAAAWAKLRLAHRALAAASFGHWVSAAHRLKNY